MKHLMIIVFLASLFQSCKTRTSGLTDNLGAFPNGVCPRKVTVHGEIVNNYAHTSTDPKQLIGPRGTKANELADIVDMFPSCKTKMAAHVKTKPSVYIFFPGFGGAKQIQARVYEGGILRWINRYDKNALIFGVSWDCAAAVSAGHRWCQAKAVQLATKSDGFEIRQMDAAFRKLTNDQKAAAAKKTILDWATKQEVGYNSALAHSIWAAAHLIDKLLYTESFGDIHIAGYSMGAHSAADLLNTDFTTDRSVGFKWSKSGVCDGRTRNNTCTVAMLKKVKWSLAMGLSGWSHALQRYNKFDSSGKPRRDAAERRLYENGGLLRIKDASYNNKLNVFNRRMDPTSNSDDQFQRGINDILLKDYNHYSHDYARPPFVQKEMVQIIEKFLNAKRPKDIPEFGIITDAAAYVTFDQCKVGASCKPQTSYLAHKIDRDHSAGSLTMMTANSVKTVKGVDHKSLKNDVAGSFMNTADAMKLFSIEQEDLRGGIEFYYKPKGSSSTRGLFSYGSCTDAKDDRNNLLELMPRSYIKGNKVYFEIDWQKTTYTVSTSSRSIKTGKWTHLAFTWDLPTDSLAKIGDRTKEPLASALAKHRTALIMAAGLRKPPPTTYAYQKGIGKMSIYINGKIAESAVLGAAGSTRGCMGIAKVVPGKKYEVGNGDSYSAFPYAAYTKDQVAIGTTNLGTMCKGYKIRNEPIFFGCAKGKAAEGYLDDVTVIFGHGRKEYSNVASNGTPKDW